MKLFQLPIALFLCSLLFVQLVKGQVEGELDAEDGLGGNDMAQKAEEEALGGEGLPEGTMPDEGGLDGEQQQPSDITNLENEGGDSGLGLQRDPTEELANSEVSQSSTFDAPTGSVDDAGTMENVPEEPILQQEAQAEETPEVQVAEPEQAKLEPSSNNKGKTDGAAKTDPQHKQEKAAETGKPERTKNQKKGDRKKVRKQERKEAETKNPKAKKGKKGGPKGKGAKVGHKAKEEHNAKAAHGTKEAHNAKEGDKGKANANKDAKKKDHAAPKSDKKKPTGDKKKA